MKPPQTLVIILLVASFLTFHPVSGAQNSTIINWDDKEAEFLDALRATQNNHTDAELYQAMGSWLWESDQKERAVGYFKKAIELDPTLYRSLYALGLLYIGTEEGDEYFRKAISKNPNYAPPYYWLGYNYCRNYKDEKAKPIFRKYLEIAEGNIDEANRVEVAIELMKELSSGEDGRELKIIRMPRKF